MKINLPHLVIQDLQATNDLSSTARECARLSLPYIMGPTQGVTNGQAAHPWQSIGTKVAP